MANKRLPAGMPDVPWITSDGSFDPTEFPIDSVLTQALSNDPGDFHTGCTMLGAMRSRGRTEAGVFLLGLLRWYRDDLPRLSTVVANLGTGESEELADALVDELRRVKSSNTTRSYLRQVIKALARLPAAIAVPRFERLTEDRHFSPKMRARFRDVADELAYSRRY